MRAHTLCILAPLAFLLGCLAIGLVFPQVVEVGGRSSMLTSVNDSNQYIHLTWLAESNAPTYFPQFSTNLAATNWQTFTSVVSAGTGIMGATFSMIFGQTAYLRVVRSP